MTFVIDTGETAGVRSLIPDWFLDQYAVAPDDSRAVHDYAYHLIGSVNNPKTMKTVREHTLAAWGFLRALAEMHPEVFDEFICAYAERALSFDDPQS